MLGTEFPGDPARHLDDHTAFVVARSRMRRIKKSIQDRRSKMGTESDLQAFQEAKQDLVRASEQARGKRFQKIEHLQLDMAQDMDDAEREMQKGIDSQIQALSKLRKAKATSATLSTETTDLIYDAANMSSRINNGDGGDCSDGRCGSRECSDSSGDEQ